MLPGADEIQTEKTMQGLLQGVEQGVELRTVKTREPASPSSILQVELARDSSLTKVNEFDRATLKKAETAEKNPLPSSEAIAQEMEHIKFKVIYFLGQLKISYWPDEIESHASYFVLYCNIKEIPLLSSYQL